MDEKNQTTQDLGRALARYQGRDATAALIMFALGIAGMMAGAWAILTIRPPSDLRGLGAGGIIAGGLFILGSLEGLINAFRDYEIIIFERGFKYSTIMESRAVRWEEVIAVWQAAYKRGPKGPASTLIYTILLKDKKKLVLNNDRFKNVEGLGETIQREVTRRLMPQYIQTLNSGGTINFGKLTLSKQGISNGKELVPWSQIRDVKIRNGVIAINKEGKWLAWSSILASQIPNLFVFLDLVDQAVGVRI